MTGKLSLATGITIALATCAFALRHDPGESECRAPGAMLAVAPDTTAELRLALNVPAYRLDVVEHGTVTRTIAVAVGMPKYRTPLGTYRIDYAIWNPWWIPPDSWWARNEHREPPGWANPTGRVKLHVTGLVFLHGTPLEQSLGSAASHACVRMTNADAIALARLVHAYAGPALPPGTLDSLESDTSRTRTVALTRTVPIDIVYRIAEVGTGELRLYPDVYRRVGSSAGDIAREAIVALLGAGVDTTGLRTDRLTVLARASRRAAVRLAIDSLFAPERTVAEVPAR